jgi:hypothetical protein
MPPRQGAATAPRRFLRLNRKVILTTALSSINSLKLRRNSEAAYTYFQVFNLRPGGGPVASRGQGAVGHARLNLDKDLPILPIAQTPPPWARNDVCLEVGSIFQGSLNFLDFR